VAAPLLLRDFPHLANARWRIRSPWDDSYRCVAWAACYTDREMWPHQDYWWFPGLPLAPVDTETPVEYFVMGFSTIGYRPCTSRKFEFGYQKVAIFANDAGVTHMARQRLFGSGWLSKLGVNEDIYHRELDDVEGDMSPLKWQYGRVAQVMKRSWWTLIVTPCGFRCVQAALKMWVYRLQHDPWDTP
jgi:hypothetical protein